MGWHLCAQFGALLSGRARLGSVRRARRRGERRVRKAPRVGLAALGAGGDALPVLRARLHVRLGDRLARARYGSGHRARAAAAHSMSESVRRDGDGRWRHVRARGHVGARALAVLVALVRVDGARVLALASAAAAHARADVLAAVDGPHESARATAVLASPSAAVAIARFLLLFFLSCLLLVLTTCVPVLLLSRFLPSFARVRNNT